MCSTIQEFICSSSAEDSSCPLGDTAKAMALWDAARNVSNMTEWVRIDAKIRVLGAASTAKDTLKLAAGELESRLTKNTRISM